jgi:hypothetical protein
MNMMGLLGACAGAVLGAAAWAAITYFTQYELALAAWAIGGVVGYGAVVLGGRGTAMAVTAAALTIVAIVAGKLLAMQLILEKEMANVIEASLGQAQYQEYLADAAAFASLDSEAQHAQFMVDHAYTEAAMSAQVSAEELGWFREEIAPMLESLHAEQPGYDEWRANATGEIESSFAEASLITFLVEDLHPLDALFALLGIITAYSVVTRASAPPAAAPPAPGMPAEA